MDGIHKKQEENMGREPLIGSRNYFLKNTIHVLENHKKKSTLVQKRTKRVYVQKMSLSFSSDYIAVPPTDIDGVALK